MDNQINSNPNEKLAQITSKLEDAKANALNVTGEEKAKYEQEIAKLEQEKMRLWMISINIKVKPKELKSKQAMFWAACICKKQL